MLCQSMGFQPNRAEGYMQGDTRHRQNTMQVYKGYADCDVISADKTSWIVPWNSSIACRKASFTACTGCKNTRRESRNIFRPKFGHTENHDTHACHSNCFTMAHVLACLHKFPHTQQVRNRSTIYSPSVYPQPL